MFNFPFRQKGIHENFLYKEVIQKILIVMWKDALQSWEQVVGLNTITMVTV